MRKEKNILNKSIALAHTLPSTGKPIFQSYISSLKEEISFHSKTIAITRYPSLFKANLAGSQNLIHKEEIQKSGPSLMAAAAALWRASTFFLLPAISRVPCWERCSGNSGSLKGGTFQLMAIQTGLCFPELFSKKSPWHRPGDRVWVPNAQSEKGVPYGNCLKAGGQGFLSAGGSHHIFNTHPTFFMQSTGSAELPGDLK